MSQTLKTAMAVVGIDIGKNSFHVVGLDQRGAIVLRQRNATAEAAHLSIVVLTFTNLSGDPSQDYFADGITENQTRLLISVAKQTHYS